MSAGDNHRALTMVELFAMVPAAEKSVINGMPVLSEMGVITLCTLVEQHLPEKADLARRLRYAASTKAAGIRTQNLN